MGRRDVCIAAGVAALALLAGIWGALLWGRNPDIVIGKVPERGPKAKTTLPRAVVAPALLAADGHGPGGPLAFRGAVNVPPDLKFFLIVGSDARPGQDVSRARADSIHIAAVDPRSRKGTILGLPRDSYVNVPGRGNRKITTALALGGPELLVQTVRGLTGLPVSYYAVTGFEGMTRIVDELHGVEVNVPYRMADRYSGAYFEAGWHHMDGAQVLAFTRARHGVPGGDFGRSENQGRVILHALSKLRAETSDEAGIRHWLGVLYRHARIDMSIADAIQLGVFARQIAPADLGNVVTPGSGRMVGGESVVVLGEEAFALFRDVGADAQADGNAERAEPVPTPSPEPTPRDKPKPKPTPTPTSLPPPPVPVPDL